MNLLISDIDLKSFSYLQLVLFKLSANPPSPCSRSLENSIHPCRLELDLEAGRTERQRPGYHDVHGQKVKMSEMTEAASHDDIRR